jgi:hypothetical protein
MQNTQIVSTKLEISILNKLNPENRNMLQNKFESKKWQLYNEQEKKELAKLLIRLSFFVGIKEPLENENLVMLVKFLIMQFPNFSNEELNQAFMLAISSDNTAIAEHFQNFSPIYISKIIKWYISEQQKIIAEYYRGLQKLQYEREEEERRKNFDPEKSLTESFILQYENYANGNFKNNNLRIAEIGVHWLLCYANELGFLKYEGNENKSLEFITEYFQELPKDHNLAIIEIKKRINVFFTNR